jgi:hypothetical protein
MEAGMIPLDSVPVKDIVLERLKVGIAQQISPALAANLTVEQQVDFMRNLVFRMQSEFLGDKLAEDAYEQSIEVPATAWDHVKQDWLPTFTRWFRWKVRTRRAVATFRVRDYHAFPESTMVYPRELGQHVKLQMVDLEGIEWQT